jgi:hypothetical protein
MAKSGTTEDKSAFRFNVVKISFVWILTTAGASVALKRKRATMGDTDIPGTPGGSSRVSDRVCDDHQQFLGVYLTSGSYLLIRGLLFQSGISAFPGLSIHTLRVGFDFPVNLS